MSANYLPAIEGRAYCSCGCGYRVSHLALNQPCHPGFGCVRLIRDGETVYPWGFDTSTDEEMERLAQDYEDVAAGHPEHDWRLQVDGPLSDYTYQRQGDGLWVLVKQGRGFA